MCYRYLNEWITSFNEESTLHFSKASYCICFKCVDICGRVCSFISVFTCSPFVLAYSFEYGWQHVLPLGLLIEKREHLIEERLWCRQNDAEVIFSVWETFDLTAYRNPAVSVSKRHAARVA